MNTFKSGFTSTVIMFSICFAAVTLIISSVRDSKAVAPPVQIETHTPEFQRAFFEAAKVYGKAGCGDQALAEMTARHSVATEVPAQLIAAQIATESNCNPLAISNRGAIGLTQIVPKVWGKEFDFSKVNLFNPDENVTVGSSILGRLIKQYGIKGGLTRYYGTGPDDVGLGGAGYAAKVLALTGKL